MERAFKGVWIPKDVWLNEELGWTEKFLLTEIDSLSKNGECFASNEYFSKFFKISKDRVSKLISDLSKKGYVEVELIYKPGTKQVEKRIITTIGYRRKQLEGIGENNYTPPGENNYYINSSFINTSIKNNDDEEAVSEINNFWDKNGFGFTLITAKNKLLDWLDEPKFEEPKEMILFALEIAVEHNVTKYAYVEAILNNWLSKGAKTLDNCKALQNERKNESNRKNPKRKKSLFEQGEESKRRFAEQAKKQEKIEIDEDFLNSLPY